MSTTEAIVLPPAVHVTAGTDEDEASPRTAPLRAWMRAFKWPLVAYLVSRLVVLAGSAVAAFVRPGQGVIDVLAAWDSVFYLTILRDGYPAALPEVAGRIWYNPVAFFPGFPVVARGVAAVLPVPDAVAAVITSTLFGAIAVVLVTAIGRRVAGDDVGERGAILFAVFPGSLALSMAYSEAVFIAFAAACLLLLLRGQWAWAGLAAALASATRPNAVAVAVACAWAAGEAIVRRREWRALIAPALAPLGVVAYFGFLWIRLGDPFVWFEVEREAWVTTPGGGTMFEYVALFIRSPFEHAQPTIVTLSLVFAFVAAWVLLRRRWPSVLAVFSLALLAISATSRNDGIRPRDALCAFPVFLGLASATRGRVFNVVIVSFTGILVVASVYHGLPGAEAP